MQKMKHIFISTLTLVLLCLLSIQLYKYREYAFEMSLLMARDKLGLASFNELKRMGTISNSFGYFNRSVTIFEKMHELKPEDKDVLSNLALALTFVNKPKDAYPFYQAYFTSGGGAQDVMYWYGQALKITGDCEGASEWFYNAVYYNPTDVLSAKELVNCLLQSNRDYEALSFMGSMLNEGKSDAINELWLSFLNRFEKQSAVTRNVSNFNESGLQKDNYSLPSLDGSHFYIPVLTKNGNYKFIKASQSYQISQVNENELQDWGWQKTLVNNNMKITVNIQSGPIEFKNLEFKICANCETQIGIGYLKNIGFNEIKKGKVTFLKSNNDKGAL